MESKTLFELCPETNNDDIIELTRSVTMVSLVLDT